MILNKLYCVYIHILPNNKIYIGITSNIPKKRWGKNGYGYRNNILFKRAIDKYGWENIKHEILYDNLSEQEAKDKEVELIALYKSNNPKYGYNISMGGDYTTLGYKFSEKQTISDVKQTKAKYGDFSKYVKTNSQITDNQLDITFENISNKDVETKFFVLLYDENNNIVDFRSYYYVYVPKGETAIKTVKDISSKSVRAEVLLIQS